MKAYRVNNPTIEAGYWVSSRAWMHGRYLVFLARKAEADSVGGYGLRALGDWGWNDSGSSFALRPIITLKANIKIDNGEGNKENPYTLKK